MSELKTLACLAPVIITLCLLAACSQQEIHDTEKVIEDGIEITEDLMSPAVA